MRKTLVTVLLMAGSLAAFAQAGSGYFSLLPGFQFRSGDADSGFVGSADAGYFFTEGLGLHLGLIFNEGKFRTTVPNDGQIRFTDQFQILEVGPELAKHVGPSAQVYAQLNVGHTFGADGGRVATPYRPPFPPAFGPVLENEWTYGGAVGYRRYFSPTAALTLQAAYHRVDHWNTNHWDARIGLTWKF